MAYSTSYDEILFLEFFTGGGLSLMNASLINLIILTVNPRDMGLATAMNGTFRNVGSSIGAPIAGSIMSTITAVYLVGSYNNVPVYAPLPSPSAYFIIFIISAAAFGLAAILTLTAEAVLGTGKKARKLKVARLPSSNPEKTV